MTTDEFNKIVSSQGAKLFREMPWRMPEQDGSFSSYKILVSELMLQQTQVPRVIPKFNEFITAFPTMRDLADASLSQVLSLWNGLGYNRRAAYLHECTRQLVGAPEPYSYDTLLNCKGIGPNTAKAVRVYAYNQPEVFIETNIRTVFIHYFFDDKVLVSDDQLLPLIRGSVPSVNARAWYWALMDIGTHIKSVVGNVGKQSSTYKKQSIFQGSIRQLRGEVLRQLIVSPKTLIQLQEIVHDDRMGRVVADLCTEQLMYLADEYYYLGKPGSR